MRKDLEDKIKYIGFIMSCTIVFLHCPEIDNSLCLNYYDYFVKNVFNKAVSSSEHIAMSWFFAVTGFLMFQNYSIDKYPAKVKKRVYSLLIPYVLWQLIFWTIDIVQGQRVFSIEEFLMKTFLFERWPIDGPLWYVYVIFLLTLLSPILLIVLKKRNIGWTAILITIFILKLSEKIDISGVRAVLDYGYVPNIVRYIPSYLVGAFYGYHYRRENSECLYHMLPAVLVAFLLDGWLTGFFAELCVKFMPIAILYLMPPINIGRINSERKYVQIYKLSFLVYAIHVPLIADLYPHMLWGYMRTIGKLSMSAALGEILMDFLYLLVSISVSAFLYWALRKKAPRVLALLTGGRG